MGLRESCKQNLSIIDGEDRVHEFTFLRITDASTNPETTLPVDLTGATIYFTVKDRVWDSDAEALIKLDTTGRVVLSDPTNGKFRVKVEREDVASLATGTYRYDIQIELALDAGGYLAGDIITPFWGDYEIQDCSTDRLELTRNDTNFFNLQLQLVTDAEATPDTTVDVNLTSATFSFLAKERPEDADSDTLVGVPTFSIVSASEGKLKVIFDPPDTAGIDFMGEEKRELYFWLKVILGTATSPYVTGDVIIPYSGRLAIRMDRTLT